MWKDIKNWEECYEVEETGNVRNKRTGKLIAGDINSAGYYRVCLYCKGHKPEKQRYFRHRLVAEHFIENPENLPEVNHKDGDKSNNHRSNLEWITRKGNELHSRMFGSKGYKPFEVKFGDGRIARYNTTPELAQECGVTKRSVLNWLVGKCAGFEKYSILSINYISSNKSLTTIENIGA